MTLSCSEFPFNQCDNFHLKDSEKIILNGIKSSIRDYRKFQDVSRLHSTNKMANKTVPEVYENQLEQLHPEVCINVPRASILKPTSRKPTFALNLAATKIELLIREIYVDIITDPRFNEIKNFVVNMILQAFSSSSPTSISNKIFSKSYRDTLLGDIDECFQEKYIELKIDEYFDASASFLMSCDMASDELLSKPKLYERYRCIWKLDTDDYKMFDRKYFLREHFRNTYKALGSDSRDDVADEYFKIGFLMNLDRFIHYFSKEMNEASAQFCDETVYDSDSCSVPIPYLSSSVETLDTVSISDTLDTVSVLGNIPKSLRFHEHANIIDINKEEPAFYVNYNIAETITI